MATPAPLSDIVGVSISVEQALQSASGFAIPMIIDDQYVYGATGRVLSVNSLSEMRDAGYGTYHKAYRLAQIMLSQSPRPKTIKIGQWDNPGAETIDDGWDAIVAADPDFYLVVCTDVTAADIKTLAASVAAESSPYLYVAETADSAVIDGTAGNVALDLKASQYDRVRPVYKAATPQVITITFDGVTTAGTFTATVDGAAAAVSEAWAVDHDTSVGTVAAALAALAGITSAVVSSSGDLGANDDVITVTSTDPYILNKIVITANFTGGIATAEVTTSASAPLAAAVVGYLAPHYPGSKIEAFARLSGVEADSLTSAQRATLISQNCGFHIQYGQVAQMGGGRNYGRVSSGALYLDLQMGVDWLTLAIQASVMNLLSGGNPIPYTASGIDSVKQAVEEALSEGVQRGFLAPSGSDTDGDIGTIGYVVSTPDIDDISAANKTARFLPDVTFQARAAGALQEIEIRGNLTQ